MKQKELYAAPATEVLVLSFKESILNNVSGGFGDTVGSDAGKFGGFDDE